MSDELKDQRVVTMMSPSEIEAIDEWMFKHRIRSRGEAIRRLCAAAMAFDAKSDDVWTLIARVAKEINDLSLEMQELRAKNDAQALHASSLQISLAALGGIIDLMNAFGPVYMQTSTARAEGQVKDAIALIKQIGTHFDGLGDNQKKRLLEIERMMKLIDFTFKGQGQSKD